VLVCAGIIALQPSIGHGEQSDTPAGLDVLFVIDRTTSMGAQDFDGDRPRIEGVAHDVEELVTKLGAARYSVILSDNVARQALPWTTDGSAVISLAQTMGWREEAYGTGSDISAAVDLSDQVLDTAAAARPDARRLVVYMGDGEQTSTDEPGSFDVLRDAVTDAVVLGYGTSEGGKMRQRPDVDDLVMRNGKPQLSFIDEKNLRRIADELGGAYEHRTAPGPIAAPVPQPAPATVVGEAPTTTSLSWIAALAAAAVLCWGLFDALRTWRRARKDARR
jgi:Ca-activated chloride channel family protein